MPPASERERPRGCQRGSLSRGQKPLSAPLMEPIWFCSGVLPCRSRDFFERNYDNLIVEEKICHLGHSSATQNDGRLFYDGREKPKFPRNYGRFDLNVPGMTLFQAHNKAMSQKYCREMAIKRSKIEFKGGFKAKRTPG